MTVGSRAGGFRGLAPFAEEDAALWRGREAETAELLQWVSEGRTPVLLTGEPGTGKTSLLLAGLSPAARRARLLPIYLEGALDWRWQFRQQMARLAGEPLDPRDDAHRLLDEHLAARQLKPLLLLDHVEQLIWVSEQDLDPLRRLVARLHAITDCRLLISVDLGHLHALEPLSTDLDGLAEARTLTLERLAADAAGALIEQTVLGGGGYIEAGLPRTIADELCADGPVLPATLQMVGHAAALRGATRAKSYHRVGGAWVLAQTYAATLARHAGGWRTRRLLSAFADQPNPRALLRLDELSRLAGLTDEEAQRKLAALAGVGLLRVLSADEVLSTTGRSESRDKDSAGREEELHCYTLLHPQLHQPARDYGAAVRRGRARAGLYLRRRIHGRQLLRPHELLAVYRFIGESLEEDERVKVRHSTTLWLGALAGLAALSLLTVALIYSALDSGRYLDRSPAVPGVDRVVLRQGRPALRFAFGLARRFGTVRSDSGIALSSLPPPQARQVRQRRVIAPVDQLDGAPSWFVDLVGPLEPVRRGTWLALAGRPRGKELLLKAAARPASRQRATEMLALLFGHDPATIRALRHCIGDRRAEIRQVALREASRLGRGDQLLQLLRQGLDDPDPRLRLFALNALHARVREISAGSLDRGLRDRDTVVRRRARVLLGELARRDPPRAFALTIDALLAPEGLAPAIVEDLDRLRGELLRQHGSRLTALLARRLGATERTPARVTMLRWLQQTPDLDSRVLLPTVDRLATTEAIDLRAMAIALQARLRGGETLLAALQELARAAQPPETAEVARQAAAAGLGLVNGVRRDVRLKTLKRLIRDRSVRVRRAAALGLLQLGGSALLELSQRIQRGRGEAVDAALQALCTRAAPQLDRRRATVVLAALWRTRQAALKRRALGCLPALAAIDAQLPAWLADKAVEDRDPAVRAAAVDAVALGLARGDHGSARRARRYLRDEAATVRAAMLSAIARRPPKDARPLLPLLERLTAATDPTVRAGAARLVSLVAADAAVSLLETLLADPQPAVRQGALAAARELPRSAAEKLSAKLTRLIGGAGAAEALLAVASARAIGLAAPLQRAAAHPETEVQTAAIGALAAVAAPQQAVATLDAALRSSTHELRLAALRALDAQSHRLGPGAVRLLGRFAAADDLTDERLAAYRALGRLRGSGVETAIPLLLEAARSPSEQQRRQALRALGHLAAGEARVLSALIDGALDSAYDARAAAQEALARHLGRSADPRQLWRALRESETNALVRRTMVAALAHHGHGQPRRQQQLEQWIARLSETTPIVVRSAARLAHALARRGEPPEPLLGWLYGW